MFLDTISLKISTLVLLTINVFVRGYYLTIGSRFYNSSPKLLSHPIITIFVELLLTNHISQAHKPGQHQRMPSTSTMCFLRAMTSFITVSRTHCGLRAYDNSYALNFCGILEYRPARSVKQKINLVWPNKEGT